MCDGNFFYVIYYAKRHLHQFLYQFTTEKNKTTEVKHFVNENQFFEETIFSPNWAWMKINKLHTKF